MANYRTGEDFLNKVYPELYFSEIVQHTKTNKDTRISAFI